MSDEYANTGFKGTLANDTTGDIIPKGENAPTSDFATGNYPPPGDSTSSGGFRSTESPQDKQDKTQTGQPDGSLIDQSTNGGPLRSQLRDAKQGVDERAREHLNPYAGSSIENRGQAEEALASRYRDARGRAYEGGGPAGPDSDPGA